MPTEQIKTCKKHGDVLYIKRTDSKWRCKQCATEQAYRRRKEIKQKAVVYKGGCCVLCGYDKCLEAMDFHHRDPKSKLFGIASSGWKRSWEYLRPELDKCDLLCANCHRELHASEINR